MHTLNKSVYIFAICLSVLAGCVDAIGFLQLGGYFISFMSGNSTRLAVNLAIGNMPAITLAGGIILVFVIGTMLGVLVRNFSKAPLEIISTIGFVTVLLTAAAFSYEMKWNFPAITLMILAMGAENAVLQRNGEVVVGVTYMTGTLVKIGQRLAHSMLGGSKFGWVPYLMLWLGLICGGITGTLLFNFLGLHGLWIAALWAAGLTAIASLLRSRIAI